MGSHIVDVIVQGRLGSDLVSALPEFSVRTESGQTHIVGPVPDQAKLFGLLDLFEQFHIEVVSINRLTRDESSPDPGDAERDDRARS